MKPIPLWLKVVVSVWILVWTPIYWQAHGVQNLLWFCDLANFLIALALWLESPLLLSSQAVSVLLVQIAWLLDVCWRLGSGGHLFGGTEYMFDASTPLGIRLLSLFHAATPPLLLWCLWRVGYDSRGWRLQTAIAWAVLPVCYFLVGPDRNLNWVWGPFGAIQTWMPADLYFVLTLIAYPLLLYLPTHLLLHNLLPESPAAAA